MKNEDIPALFEARLNFYEARRVLYSRLAVTTASGADQQDHLEDATSFANMARVLLMTDSEMQAADRTAKGPLAGAIADEFVRRSELTGHQGLQETGARTKARRDRQLRVDRIRKPIKDREIELD